jgi:hypothetical protein
MKDTVRVLDIRRSVEAKLRQSEEFVSHVREHSKLVSWLLLMTL